MSIALFNIPKLRINRIKDSFFSKQVNETLLILLLSPYNSMITHAKYLRSSLMVKSSND